MAESQGTDDRSGGAESPPGAPRWVKVAGLIVLVVAVVLVVVMLAVGGEHGPGRHTGAESAAATSASRTLGGPEPG